MIGFYDFNPDMDGSVDDALRRASEWVERHNVDIVNIETVVVPKFVQIRLTPGSWTGSAPVEARQFVRVWYRAEKRIDPPGIGVSQATHSTPKAAPLFGDQPPFKMPDISD